MCTPKAAGGQRCASSTAKALTNATKRCERTLERYQQAKDRGASPVVRAETLATAMKAYHQWEDALVEHATTDAGRAEIEALRDAAPAYPHKGETAHVRADYEDALQTGAFLRARRAEVKDAVRSGALDAQHAEERAAYPNEFAIARRVKQIEATKAREEAAARPPVNLPSGVSAPEGTHITKVYFVCENHDKPGACTVECAQLVAGMDTVPGADYDPTGTSYGPPSPYTEYHYDEIQRASIAATFTPSDD